VRTEDAFTLAQRMIIGVTLFIFLSILLIPGRGVLRKDESRAMAQFFLIVCGLIFLWVALSLNVILLYFRKLGLFSDEILLFIARLGLVQAAIGILALGAKGIALLIPYAKRYVARLSELTWFHKPR